MTGFYVHTHTHTHPPPKEIGAVYMEMWRNISTVESDPQGDNILRRRISRDSYGIRKDQPILNFAFRFPNFALISL